MAPMITLHPVLPGDWPDLWPLLEPVFRAGETYALPRDISEEEARRLWVEIPEATFVARNEAGSAVGTYFLKPNQLGPGSHVANAGYVVDEKARGRGIASRLCEHSLEEARRRGYRAMQFNLVVATNTVAVHLWQKHGFRIVGTLPGAFRHATLGFVDAFVMYRSLTP
ncbi:MAG: GNAT family N-acetyltransferase [Capsulimonadales bacterium]|nr:GNAT family N-acetyltransferase [Capsulimonadales bacterium]